MDKLVQATPITESERRLKANCPKRRHVKPRVAGSGRWFEFQGKLKARLSIRTGVDVDTADYLRIGARLYDAYHTFVTFLACRPHSDGRIRRPLGGLTKMGRLLANRTLRRSATPPTLTEPKWGASTKQSIWPVLLTPSTPSKGKVIGYSYRVIALITLLQLHSPSLLSPTNHNERSNCLPQALRRPKAWNVRSPFDCCFLLQWLVSKSLLFVRSISVQIRSAKESHRLSATQLQRVFRYQYTPLHP